MAFGVRGAGGHRWKGVRGGIGVPAEALVQALFDSAPVGMAIVDADLRYLQLNEALAAMNRRPVEEHLGRTPTEVLGESSGPALEHLLRTVLHGAEPVLQLEVDGVRADGSQGRFVGTFSRIEHLGAPAGVIGVVQDVTEIAERDRQLRTLIEANVVGVMIVDDDKVLDANAAYLRLVGATQEDLQAGRLSWRAMTPPEWQEADRRAMRSLQDEGWIAPYEKEYVHADGRRVPILVGGAMLTTDPPTAVCFVVDQSERQEQKAIGERLLSRVSALQSVAAALAGALTEADVVRAVLREGAAAAGAACVVVGIVDERGQLEVRYRSGHDGPVPDPRAMPLASRLPMPEALRTGRPVLVGSRAEWTERFEQPPRGDFEAFVAIPVVLDGVPRACLGIGYERAREFDDEHRELMAAFQALGSQALARAWLYEERAEVTDVLQRELRPIALPSPSWLRPAVRYVPQGRLNDVSGDFYDVFEVGEDCWAVIGDVCGKGIEASVVTSLARHTIRALARAGCSPLQVAEGLDAALLDRTDDPRFATTAILRLRPGPHGTARAEHVVAGHPLPLVRRAGGRLDRLPTSGALLGAALGAAPLRPHETVLEPGDLLVLFTDGVTEARGPAGTFGHTRLEALVAAQADGPQAAADAVVDAVLEASADDPRDDIAVLAIEVAADGGLNRPSAGQERSG